MGAMATWLCRCSTNPCVGYRPTTSIFGKYTACHSRTIRSCSFARAERPRRWRRPRKPASKVRFCGFTGHKHPDMHLAMLHTGFPFDAVQMPLNAFDANFRSFESNVLPALNKRQSAVLGMKPLNGHGDAIKKGVISAQQALRYAMSLPVTTTITGIDSLEVLRQNLGIAQAFEPMSSADMQLLRDRCKPHAADGRFELYK